jgi:predicted RNase H-like HicB family nuclease
MVSIKKKPALSKGLSIELIPDPELGGFTAHVPNIPAYGEGETEKEAIADLKEALALYIEVRGVGDAMDRVVSPSKICFVNWKLEDIAHE